MTLRRNGARRNYLLRYSLPRVLLDGDATCGTRSQHLSLVWGIFLWLATRGSLLRICRRWFFLQHIDSWGVKSDASCEQYLFLDIIDQVHGMVVATHKEKPPCNLEIGSQIVCAWTSKSRVHRCVAQLPIFFSAHMKEEGRTITIFSMLSG